jgi:hypothetical protein
MRQAQAVVVLRLPPHSGKALHRKLDRAAKNEFHARVLSQN